MPVTVTDVMFTASAVKPYWSVVSVLIEGVALEAVVVTLGVMRLFVSVSVVARPTSVSVDVGNVSVPVLLKN